VADDDYRPVRVFRRIDATASEIFQVLADPVRHLDLDGSGMLVGAATEAPVSGVGDFFSMRMRYSEHGEYLMHNHVVAFEPDRRIGWEPVWGGRADGLPSPEDEENPRWGHSWTYELSPDGPDATIVTEVYDCSAAPADERAAMEDGRCWIPAMADTLLRLDEVCTGRASDQPG
jgi:hypothetical protein